MNKNSKIKFKSLVLAPLVVSTMMSGAEAASINSTSSVSDIDRIQYELDELKREIKRLESQDYSTVKNNILNDIKFNGRLHIELLDSNNKGNTFGVLEGNIAEKRYFNSQITKLEFGARKKLSDKSNLVFLIKADRDLKIKFDRVYLDYRIFPKITVDFGQIYAPISLEDEDSSDSSSLIDETRYYNAGDIFSSTSGVGVRMNYTDTFGGITTGIYGNSANSDISETSRLLLSFRSYFNPYLEDYNLVHLGFSYVNSNNKFSNGDTLPSTLADIAAGKDINLKYSLKRVENFAFELAINYDWFNLEAEYALGFVKPSAIGYDKKFSVSNYYVKTDFMLYGGIKTYKYGNFGPIKVLEPLNEGGLGAISLSFRFADTDMNDKKKDVVFDYGQYREYSTAINWMPTNFVKLILQYSRVEEKFTNAVAILVNDNKADNKYNVVALKGKIFF